MEPSSSIGFYSFQPQRLLAIGAFNSEKKWRFRRGSNEIYDPPSEDRQFPRDFPACFISSRSSKPDRQLREISRLRCSFFSSFLHLHRAEDMQSDVIIAMHVMNLDNPGALSERFRIARQTRRLTIDADLGEYFAEALHRHAAARG